jgi:hypothetical protein
MTAEHERLKQIQDDVHGWRRWGPYVSDRAWAGVREDYSSDGGAWDYLPHDLARSTAYRWGEDGIAGICDRYQLLCFAPAFWNRKDPILKERYFGLTCTEGNRGEDVKEYYFHLDNLPSHAYMKLLYKYPQREYPYRWIVDENRRRGGTGMEFELLDTGIFAENRYFDIFIEYAKVDEEDIVVKIEAFNRGPEPAPLDILPHLWFRNTWAWGPEKLAEPLITPGPSGKGFVSLKADLSEAHIPDAIPVNYKLGERTLYGSADALQLFTNNETNPNRGRVRSRHPVSAYWKDAFDRWLVRKEANAVNPDLAGTKSSLVYRFDAIPAGGSAVVKLRLSQTKLSDPLAEVDSTIAKRKAEADEYYAAVHPPKATADEKHVQRLAFAGLLWTKMSYLFDVKVWLEGDDPRFPPPESRKHGRNRHWKHLNSMRVMLPAEKWEYPWFAAWDLALTCPPLALIDPAFAKDQLYFLLFDQFQHPNGQIPAYEWEFSDLNPPVHAGMVWRVYVNELLKTGKGDRGWLERCFHKLLVNFAWWINKVDQEGNNVFEGGFLGMDNITIIDRSEKARDGSVLDQSDGTGYMAHFCLVLMRMALELAKENKEYELMAVKFFQHYAIVADAMKNMGGRGYQLWDEEDGYFYDVLRYPDGRHTKFRVRSLVGLVPLFAVERLESEWLENFPTFHKNFKWLMKNRADLLKSIVHEVPHGGKTTYALTILDQQQLARIMHRFWNEDEFLSDYGPRSLSRVHLEHPFVMDGKVVSYEPAESDNKIKGGNSNWRGPIWMPTSFLLIESLRKLGKAFGTSFELSPPAAKGDRVTFSRMANELADRVIRIFTRDAAGRRPIWGGARIFQEDPHWKDHVLIYEYFHGDNGAGLGAGHQTGWTALVATLIDEWRR